MFVGIRAVGQLCLDIADRIVSKITYQSTVEFGQAFSLGNLEEIQIVFDVLQRIGGFFFGGISGLSGVALGTLYVNVGATVGAFLVFLAARFFLGDMVHEKYGPKLEKFNRELDENGKNYLLTMRFIPIFPFWMINLLAGVAKVSPVTFLWTTSLGIIPGSAVYNYVGYDVPR